MLESKADGDFCGPANEDLPPAQALALALAAFVLLIAYYYPALSLEANFYFSDISYFFQPFCHFISQELSKVHAPLWNPYLYCGMSQLEMPNPSLLYLPSWLLFLLPFSAGLSLYMIFHHLLLAGGTFLYLRRLQASRAASLFAAICAGLCGYFFTLTRNFTLPASVAWLPLALYFQHCLLECGSVRKYFCKYLGLALSVSAVIYVARPEVGLPALVILAIAGCSNCWQEWRKQSVFKSRAELFLVLNSLTPLLLGVLLSLPTLIAGMEWAALSPRGHGLEQRFVFTWSANWYDFLGMILAQPLGDLEAMSEQAAKFRSLVLSRAGYVPFLETAYITPILFTCAIWGFSDRKESKRFVLWLLLAGFVILALGRYTPIGPFFVSLSSTLAAFRYPVKLLVFPGLILTFFAARGFDLVLRKELKQSWVMGCGFAWLLLGAAGAILCLLPAVGEWAADFRWLFRVKPDASVLLPAQKLMGQSMLLAGALGAASCLLAWACLRGRVKRAVVAVGLIGLAALALFGNALCDRQMASADFYKCQSAVATRLKELAAAEGAVRDGIGQEQDGNGQRLDESGPVGNGPEVSGREASDRAPSGRAESALGGPFRVLCVYKDPLALPKDYGKRIGREGDEKFFRYARELAFYDSSVCFGLYSSNGYEAAETSDYKACFSDAINCSSQRRATNASDAPIHRFCLLTATSFVCTQAYRLNKDEKKPVALLDGDRFELVDENKDLNFRIFKVKGARKRAYFAEKLVFLKSFESLKKVLKAEKKPAETKKSGTKPSETKQSVTSPAEMKHPGTKPSVKGLDETAGVCFLLASDRDKYGAGAFEGATELGMGVGVAPGPGPGPNGEAVEGARVHPQLPEPGEIRAFSDEGQRICLSTKTAAPRVLVLADHYYPGWHARLDGKEIEILRANVFQRAFLIPPGEHQLELFYFPDWIQNSALASLAALAAFLLANVILFKQNVKPGQFQS